MNQVTCIVLCGGKGTRLHAITGDRIPKCIVEVGGKPFLWHVLHKIVTSGIKRIVCATGHHGEIVYSFVESSEFRPYATCVQDNGLGTGGATRFSLGRSGASAFDTILVVNGDTFWTGNYAAPVAAARFEERIVVIHTNGSGTLSTCAGVYAAPQTSLLNIPSGVACDLDKHIIAHAGSGAIMKFTGDKFFDIGTPTGLLAAQGFFEKREA